MTDFLRAEDKIEAARAWGESQFREFKSALEGLPTRKQPRSVRAICRDIGETLVAFANADGGELLVGVENDTTITGVPHSEEDLQRMVSAPVTHVLSETPLPPPVIARVTLEGKTVLYFAVDKSTQYVHQTSDGRTLQRKDTETRPVAMEMVTLERQERASREYDRQYVDGADASELDADLVIRARDAIPSAAGRSAEAFLGLLKLLDFSASGVHPGLRRSLVMSGSSECDVEANGLLPSGACSTSLGGRLPGPR